MTTTTRIGDAINRIDGHAKVTGQARYAAEHFEPGLLHGWIVSSPIAKGRIVSIDDAAARAIPGVVDVITHANRPHVAWLARSYDDDVSPPGAHFRPLHDDRIAFSMQPVALVVAETLEAARDAAALVDVHCEAEAHNTNLLAALPDKFEPRRKRMGFSAPKSRGDARQAHAAAALKMSGDFHMPAHHHNPMEMHAATVIWAGNGKITVHDKTQGAANVQAYLASALGFSKDDVRVLNPYVGGAFGSGLRPQYHVFLAALAARRLERSVRVAMTRAQMFSHVHRPETLQSVALATDAEGRLQAIVNEATTVTSRFEHYMETVVDWGLMNYACENASGHYTITEIDTYTPGDMRAPGAATGMTMFEMAIDEMASVAGVDPLAWRTLNYSDKDAMHDRPFTSKALREAYAAGAERFGWSRRSAAPRSMRDGSELVGWGVATGMWDAMFRKTSARARLSRDGRLRVSCATADIGTGSYTVMAQVAGDTLGLPSGRIDVRLGDTDLPAAPVEGGSWGAASTGAAVQVACQAVGHKLADAARHAKGGPLHGFARDAILFVDGHLVARDDASRRVSLQEALDASGEEFVEAEESAGPGIGGLIGAMRKSRNTHSAIFAEVKVDEDLGVVRVTRIVIAVAAGRIINPKTARSQILGGVVMGIGMALHEETLMDDRFGRFMNHSFAEYHVPTNADIDSIEVIFVDEPDPEVTPLGVKGLGEIGIVGTAAAVANAIFHATGTRVRSLPITLDKLLQD